MPSAITWVADKITGSIIGGLFIAICTLLGFGPQDWLQFMIQDLPSWFTPYVARVLLLGLAAIVSVFILNLYFPRFFGRAVFGGHDKTQQRTRRESGAKAPSGMLEPYNAPERFEMAIPKAKLWRMDTIVKRWADYYGKDFYEDEVKQILEEFGIRLISRNEKSRSMFETGNPLDYIDGRKVFYVKTEDLEAFEKAHPPEKDDVDG